MSSKNHNICLLFCGGSSIITDDGILTVQQEGDMKKWLAAMPELGLIANIDPVFVYGGDASEIEPGLWQRLAREIHTRIDQYDGFVVTHGIDTIIYTAAMQSFMLAQLPKPIIFTGSPLAQDAESTNHDLTGMMSSYKTLGVKANLINAVQVATMNIAEVAIMFGNRLIRATETVKSDTASFNFFDANSDAGLLGKVDFGIKLFDRVRKRAKRAGTLSDRVDEHVCLYQLVPGVQASQLQAMIERGCHGIMVRSFNTNLFPQSFEKVLAEAYQKGIPVVAHNPYALDLKKKKREYILINDLTFETAFVKFMWVLGQTNDLGKIRLMMWEKQ